MGSVPVAIWNPAGRLDPLYDPEDATELPVNLQGDSTSVPLLYPPGQVLGEVTAVPGLYGAYNDSLSDGTNVARMINRYRSTVLGAAGAIGAITSYGGEWPGMTWRAQTAFKSGDFDLSKIIGLDANGLADMYGRIIEGALGTNESDSVASASVTGTFQLNVPAQTINSVVYPAFSLPLLSATLTAASLQSQLNAALVANGIPAYVVCSGGAIGTNPIVVVWHGVYGSTPIVMVVDNTNNSGTAVVNTRTAGVAASGVIRFG